MIYGRAGRVSARIDTGADSAWTTTTSRAGSRACSHRAREKCDAARRVARLSRRGARFLAITSEGKFTIIETTTVNFAFKWSPRSRRYPRPLDLALPPRPSSSPPSREFSSLPVPLAFAATSADGTFLARSYVGRPRCLRNFSDLRALRRIIFRAVRFRADCCAARGEDSGGRTYERDSRDAEKRMTRISAARISALDIFGGGWWLVPKNAR